MKTWIFDVDGTLANTDHRNHYLQKTPKNWTAWTASAIHDTPYWEIVDLVQAAHNLGIRVVIATGRMEHHREQTTEWLEEHNIVYDLLYMRAEGDFRDDNIVKKEYLDDMREKSYNPVMVFEDRDRVVDMWRANGIKCLQVQPGAY